MTESPDFFADRPEHAEGRESDPDQGSRPDLLSGMLRDVRLRGEEIFCCPPPAPFAISFAHRGGTIHIVNDGQFELQLEGDRATHRYQRGDVILLPSVRPHVIRAGKRVPAPPLSPTDMRPDVVRDRIGTRWLAGTFSFDASRGAQLLQRLPPIIELRGAGNQSL